MKTCPKCAEEVQDAATVCKHCGNKLQFEMSNGGYCLIIVAMMVGIGMYASSPGLSTSSSPSMQESADLVHAAQQAQRWQQAAPLKLPTKSEPFGSARAGFPTIVATAAITEAGHACGKVKNAVRLPEDGQIIATCSNGKRYRVFEAYQVGSMALDCAAAKKLLNVDGC